MPTSRRNGRLLAAMVGAMLAATVALDARAAEWYSSSGGVSIDQSSLAASTRTGGASVWVRYEPTLSVDCSPPPKCYAKSQRINVHFSCSPRYALQMERISMDLNGNVVNHEVREAAAGYAVVGTDFVGDAVLSYFCAPLYEQDPPYPFQTPQTQRAGSAQRPAAKSAR